MKYVSTTTMASQPAVVINNINTTQTNANNATYRTSTIRKKQNKKPTPANTVSMFSFVDQENKDYCRCCYNYIFNCKYFQAKRIKRIPPEVKIQINSGK